jgi:tetratricopeptide (TPR) repeat protein
MATAVLIFALSSAARAGESEPAAGDVRVLIEAVMGDDFASRIDAERGILAIGTDALKALLVEEASAKGVNLLRIRRLRRMVSYGLTSTLESDLSADLNELETRIKGRDWNALIGALNHTEGEVIELARGIIRKVGTHYLGLLAKDDEAGVGQATGFFLNAPSQAAGLLRFAVKAGKEPLAGRAKNILLKIARSVFGALSDERGDVRDKAEEMIFEVGRTAGPMLEKAAAGKDADLAYRAKRLLVMIDFRVSPGLYERIGHILSGYDGAGWRKRRDFVIEVERLCQADGRDVLMAIIEREKSSAVRETAGAALLRTVVMLKGDFSIVKFLMEHGIIKTERIPAITLDIYLAQGIRYIQKEEYEKALSELKQALAIDPGNKIGLYNAACCYSLLKKTEKAILFLQKSIDAGFVDWRHIENDKDLDNIRDDERYKEIIKKLKAQDKDYDPEKEE